VSQVENLEKLRAQLVSARRQQVAKALRLRAALAPVGRIKATQDIIDALDRAITDEKRLNPQPVQQPEIGIAHVASPRIGGEQPPHVD
jgi:hypothetical protein